MNLITFQYKFSSKLEDRDVEKKHYIPKVQIWLNSENKKNIDSSEIKFEYKTVILQPIGFDDDCDKVDIIYDLYQAENFLKSSKFFNKIKAYYLIWKWKVILFFDPRYAYCVQFNSPLNKL